MFDPPSHAISLIDDRPSILAAFEGSGIPGEFTFLLATEKLLGPTFYLDAYSHSSSMCSRSKPFHLTDLNTSRQITIDIGCGDIASHKRTAND
jgi:hypothetical protein